MKKYFMFKKISLMMLMVMSFMICLPAFAAESGMSFLNGDRNIVQPRFTNIAIFQNSFSISSSGKVEVMSYLTARSVTEVKIEAHLQQNKNGVWTTIKSWSGASKGTNSGLEGSGYVLKGYKYRLISNGKVYRNGSLIEETSFVSESKSY